MKRRRLRVLRVRVRWLGLRRTPYAYHRASFPEGEVRRLWFAGLFVVVTLARV